MIYEIQQINKGTKCYKYKKLSLDRSTLYDEMYIVFLEGSYIEVNNQIENTIKTVCKIENT